jgi:hypothetical protein
VKHGGHSTFRLSLPDGEIEITDETTPSERQQIVDDLRARHPELLAGNRLERIILGDESAFEELAEEAGTSSPDGSQITRSIGAVEFDNVRLELPDGEIVITDKTTPAERQRILDDLRSRHPEFLAQDNRLEGLILGSDTGAFKKLAEVPMGTTDALEMSFPDGDVLVTDQTTNAERREILDDLVRRYPNILTKNPELEGMIMDHGNAPTRRRTVLDSPPVESAIASPEMPLVGPVQEQRSLLSKLFRR